MGRYLIGSVFLSTSFDMIIMSSGVGLRYSAMRSLSLWYSSGVKTCLLDNHSCKLKQLPLPTKPGISVFKIVLELSDKVE